MKQFGLNCNFEKLMFHKKCILTFKTCKIYFKGNTISFKKCAFLLYQSTLCPVFLVINNPIINRLCLHQFLGTKATEANKSLKTDANGAYY